MRFLSLLRLFRLSPGVFLFFIAPGVGALLSGFTPPNQFFNPLTLLFLCFLYGGGAIISRELMLYWGKGWPTLLLLGAAFGVIYEGLLTKSLFDLRWPALGSLGVYGRLEGVNWVWSLQQTTFHAVFSFAIPILIVGLLFPKRRAERWAGPRSLLLLIILFVASAILGALFLSSYHPPLILYVATLAVAAVLILLARYLPRSISVTKSTGVAEPLRFGLVGFLGTLTLFLINWLLPTTLTPWWVAILLMLVLAIIVAGVTLLMSGNATAWTQRHQIALVSGALAFFILLAPYTEIFQRQRDSSGLTFVALVTIGLLYLLTRRIRAREKRAVLQGGMVV